MVPLGVPIIRITVFGGLQYLGGLDWGPPILGNYHISSEFSPKGLEFRLTLSNPT